MLNSFNRYSFYLLIFLSAIELTIYTSWENLVGVLVLNIGWWSISKMILTWENLIVHPAIFYMSLGLGLFYYYLPLLSTLIASRPLTYEFQLPYQVFIHQFVYLVSYIAAFYLYTENKIRPRKIRKYFNKLDFYSPLTTGQIWMMGAIGVLVFIYTRMIFGYNELDADEVPPLIRFLLPFKNFIYAPLIGLFPTILSSQKTKDINKNVTPVYLFVGLIIIMGIMSNGRQFMVSSILLLFLLYSFKYLKEKTPVAEILTPRKFLTLLILVIVLAGPMAKMANTMVKVRSFRNDLTPIELLSETFKAYQTYDSNDKTQNQYWSFSDGDWVEDYTGNVFFNRMCNLRIADLTLYYNGQQNLSIQERINYFVDPILAQIPGPFLNLLGINLDKYGESASWTASSIAYIDYTGLTGSGKKSVAAHAGTGVWLFGTFYPLIFIAIYFVIFYLMDSFHTVKEDVVIYSPLLFINLYSFFSFLNFKNGIISDLLFIGRPYIQLCFLYFLIYRSTSYLVRLSKTYSLS